MEIFNVVIGTFLALGISALLWCCFMILCIRGGLGKYFQFTFGHNYNYSREWDSKVVEALNTSKVKTFDKYSITFENGVAVWIENKYYGYAQDSNNPHKYRTSWKTAKRIMKLEKELMGEEK